MKNEVLIQFGSLRQKLWAFLFKFWLFFTMLTHQIWSCHVAQDAKSDKNYLFLILHIILGKVTKFLVEKLSTSEVLSQKPLGGVETLPPPGPLGLIVKSTGDFQIRRNVLSLSFSERESGKWPLGLIDFYHNYLISNHSALYKDICLQGLSN